MGILSHTVLKQPLENSFVVPDAALADVPAALRAPAEPRERA